MNSLHFKIKDTVDVDKHQVIELFFKGWIDYTCKNYRIERNVEKDWLPGMVRYRETFRVDFERPEDCLALKLRGIPSEFQKFLEIVK